MINFIYTKSRTPSQRVFVEIIAQLQRGECAVCGVVKLRGVSLGSLAGLGATHLSDAACGVIAGFDDPAGGIGFIAHLTREVVLIADAVTAVVCLPCKRLLKASKSDAGTRSQFHHFVNSYFL